MTRPKDSKSRQAQLDSWCKRLLAAYTRDLQSPDRTEASIELGDLAMFDPTTFWEFVEYVAASPTAVEKLSGLGHGGLYWLLRNHPDDYDKRLAALVRDDERFRYLIHEVDSDLVAPDVWRKIEAGLRGEQIED
jgi:hypothetical protein